MMDFFVIHAHSFIAVWKQAAFFFRHVQPVDFFAVVDCLTWSLGAYLLSSMGVKLPAVKRV